MQQFWQFNFQIINIQQIAAGIACCFIVGKNVHLIESKYFSTFKNKKLYKSLKLIIWLNSLDLDL